MHEIDCLPPCYIYVTCYASTVNGTASYDISLSAEGSVSQLVDEVGSEQTLGPLESQDFYYRLLNKKDPILLGVSCPEGQIAFKVSNTRSFDLSEEHTTALGKEVALLASTSEIVQNANDVLYIRVMNIEAKPATFVVTCRNERCEELKNGGTPLNAALRPKEINHYVASIPGGPSLPNQHVRIVVEALAGNPNIYVSITDPHVDPQSAQWNSEAEGSDEINLNSTTEEWTGKVYIGVSSIDESAYSLIATWGKQTVETLLDGVRAKGRVGETQYYKMDGAGDLRLSVLTGSVMVCVKEPSSTNLCQNVSRDQVAAFTTNASQIFEVSGLEIPATFHIWALISAPLTLHDGEMCRDRLELNGQPHRSRLFQNFILPGSLIQVTVSPERCSDCLTLRGRRSGEENWSFEGTQDGDNLVLKLNQEESARLENRWLEILVDATADINYTITVDCGQMHLESQEILMGAPPLPITTPLSDSRLFRFDVGEDAYLYLAQCLHQVRVATGRSAQKLDRVHNASRAFKLKEHEHFALITSLTSTSDNGEAIYEVSIRSSPNSLRARDGLVLRANDIVSIPVISEALRMTAFFVREDFGGLYHIDTLCGLRAMLAQQDNTNGFRIERIPTGSWKTRKMTGARIGITPPWQGHWLFNVLVEYDEKDPEIFYPISNYFQRAPHENMQALVSDENVKTPVRGGSVLLWIVAIGVLWLVTKRIRTRFSNGLFIESYTPALELPLQPREDSYERSRYEPPW